MMAETRTCIAEALTDARNWLIEAEDPLADLQLRLGGALPGAIAVPALLELVCRARQHGAALTGSFEAHPQGERVSASVELVPEKGGAGCRLRVLEWNVHPAEAVDGQELQARKDAIDSHVAELVAQLGPGQEVLSVECESCELSDIALRLGNGRGQRWSDLLGLADPGAMKQAGWQHYVGIPIEVGGSPRTWTARVLPKGPGPGSGYELLILAAEAQADSSAAEPLPSELGPGLYREIGPALRQPVSRIVANAETIRTRLAGPLDDAYSAYAADIASAGEHLLGLIDDLADLEAVEAADFKTGADRIDLAAAARRAATMLAAAAHAREIEVEAPREGEEVLACGELRRAVQILLNLLGNALRYAPEQSRVWVRAERVGQRALVTVIDQGPGLTESQQARVFDKFERLGRKDEGGSGLGLYIARRLARAMGGDLTVESTPGSGARFTLQLPAYRAREADPD